VTVATVAVERLEEADREEAERWLPFYEKPEMSGRTRLADARRYIILVDVGAVERTSHFWARENPRTRVELMPNDSFADFDLQFLN
jgi:hypothetical protein